MPIQLSIRWPDAPGATHRDPSRLPPRPACAPRLHRLRSTALVEALGQGRAAWWHDPRSGRYLLHTTRRGRLYHYTLRPAGLFLLPAPPALLPND